MAMAVGIFLLTVMLFMAAMGLLSHFKQPALGLHQGALQPCPAEPNCVCSEAGEGQQHTISSLNLGRNADVAWSQLQKVMGELGGKLIHSNENYLHAEFTSLLFRFVDDFEARLDQESGQIHLRSASRVGHSDLGANRKRVEAIRIRFEAAE